MIAFAIDVVTSFHTLGHFLTAFLLAFGFICLFTGWWLVKAEGA